MMTDSKPPFELPIEAYEHRKDLKSGWDVRSSPSNPWMLPLTEQQAKWLAQAVNQHEGLTTHVLNLEEAVTDALEQAKAEWAAGGNLPGDSHARDVEYYEEALKDATRPQVLEELEAAKKEIARLSIPRICGNCAFFFNPCNWDSENDRDRQPTDEACKDFTVKPVQPQPADGERALTDATRPQVLEELEAAKKERDRLVAVMQSAAITLRQEFAGADDKEMEMAFGIADSLSASVAPPQPADGRKETIA